MGRARATLAIIATLATVGLPACGGGGGGGAMSASDPSMPAPAPAPPPVIPYTPSAEELERRAAFETDEYNTGLTVRLFFGTVEERIPDNRLDRIRASSAYARGATGAGETVLVVDTGIRETHREFDGTGRVTVGETVRTGDTPYVPTDAQKRHGTAVAGIIAARRGPVDDGDNMHGVAFDAAVYFSEIELGTGTGVYMPYDLDAHTEGDDLAFAADQRRYLELAAIGGASIINQSFGLPGVISQYDADQIRRRLRHTAAAIAQAGVPAAERRIFVRSAGNEAGRVLEGTSEQAPHDSPNIFPGLGAHFPELRGHMVAVIALDQDGTVAGYSNHCGIARANCLAAPGSGIVFPDAAADDRYRRGNGTSYAAPIVSGALAVMRQHFRGQLGNTELVSRLFATANSSGIYADAAVYGHGLLDLDQATRPLGRARIAVGTDVDGPSRPLGKSWLGTLGGAAGDALRRGLAGRELAVFDDLGSPFFIDAASRVADVGPGTDAPPAGLSPVPGETGRARFPVADGELLVGRGRDGAGSVGHALYQRTTGDGHGLFLLLRGQPARLFGPWRDDDGPAPRLGRHLPLSAPHLRFVGDGAGVGGSLPLPRGSRLAYGIFRGPARLDGWDRSAGDDNLGLLLELGASGESWSIQAGMLDEAAGFAGISPRGAFGKASGRTLFGGLAAGADLPGNWRAWASAHAGHTRPRLRARGSVRDASPVVTSSFAVAIEGRGIAAAGDTLGISLFQPLRIERGSARVRLPVGRDTDRRVLHETIGIGLEPSARTLDLRLMYARSIGPARVGVALGAERHAGHSRANGTDLHGSVSLGIDI